MIESIKLCTCFSPLPCAYAYAFENPKIFHRILWVYLLQTLMRPHSSTGVTKGFKRHIAYAKYNRDSYDSELSFRVLFFLGQGRAKARRGGIC